MQKYSTDIIVLYTMTKWDLSQECKGDFNIRKSMNVIHHINRIKGEKT